MKLWSWVFLYWMLLSLYSCDSVQQLFHKSDVIGLQDWYIKKSANPNVNAGYGSISNNGERQISLIAVQSASFNEIEMHRVLLKDNLYKMQQQLTVDIAVGRAVTFQPGNLHLMLFDPEFEGRETVQLNFLFSNSESRTITANIK